MGQEVFWEATTPALAGLVRGAVEMADLSAADVYSLADWIAPLSAELADDLGLILVAQFLAAGEGSLALELSRDAIARRLEDVLAPEGRDAWIDRALANLNAGRFEHVVGDGNQDADLDRRPLLTWKAHGRTFLYFQKHLRAERELDAAIRERIGRPSRRHSDDAVRLALVDALETNPLRSSVGPIRWDRDQLTAIGLAMLRDLAIISGGPGTGKTSVVLTLLRCLVRLGVSADRIALAAPTGRAAQRLSDSLRAGLASLEVATAADRSLKDISASTLHSLLSYLPNRGIYRRHEENPIAADVVIVDEVSMVSVEQMAALVRALPETAKLVLLGDKDQLPSVDAGAILAQLVGDRESPGSASAPGLSSETRARLESWLPGIGRLEPGDGRGLGDSVVVLRTNHRSERGIREAAEAINAQRPGGIESLPRFDPAEGWPTEAGCFWWEPARATPAELHRQLEAWARHVYRDPVPGAASLLETIDERRLEESSLETPEQADWLRRVFAGLEAARLLTLVRQGPWGCEPINETLRAWLARQRRGVDSGDWLSGSPILITRNDRSRDLYNGDVGIVLRNSAGDPRVVFARQSGYLSMSPWMLPGHELGFAMTVHKSQGSEFAEALVILPAQGGRRLLTKELLYTAVTRAKRRAIISGTADAFRLAVSRRIVRESGMSAMS